MPVLQNAQRLPIEETVVVVSPQRLQGSFSALLLPAQRASYVRPLTPLLVCLLITKPLEGTIATVAKDACLWHLVLVICSMLKAWIQDMERGQGSSHVLSQLLSCVWVVTLLMSRRSFPGENEWVELLPSYGAAVENGTL